MPLGRGTHFKGPILGSSDSQGGLFRNVPAPFISMAQSKFQCWYEDFSHSPLIAPTADGLVGAVAGTGMNGSGWTVTQIGAVAGNTVGTQERLYYLLVNCGTAADTGYNLQHNFTVTAAATSPLHNVWGPQVNTAAGMDNKELVWSTRINYLHTGAWASKFFVGIGVSGDTGLMTAGTGALDGLSTGGCVGFHVSEAGVLSAATSAVGGGAASLVTLDTIDDHTTGGNLLQDDNWLELGFRMSFGDASDSTDNKNFTEFYVGGRKVTTVVGDNPFRSTQTYATTIEALNGGAGTEAFDLGVDYLFTAIVRSGATYNNYL